MSELRFLCIKYRLWLVLLMGIAGLAVIAWFGLESVRSRMMEEKKLATRHVVDTAESMVAPFHSLAESGEMTVEEATAVAKSLRYEEADYFWINDKHPKMVMRAVKPALDGKDLSDFEEPTPRAPVGASSRPSGFPSTV